MMDYQQVLVPAVVNLPPSGIRRFFDLASSMDGVISLGVGEPDFQTPWPIRQAAIQSLEKGHTWYTPNAGQAVLRREIARDLEEKLHLLYDPDTEILVTVGGSEGIDMAIRCLVQSGDEVLVVEPSFVCYKPIVTMAGGKPVVIPTRADDDFRLTPAALREAITPKTRLLILPSPNNPTGAVMRKEDLSGIAEVLKDTNIVVLSDEIYSELTYVYRHVSIASLADMQERTVIINGFSKSYAMTGWRMGYAVGPRPIIEQMLKLHQYAIMCAPTTSQFAAYQALKEGERAVSQMRGEYDTRRRYLLHALREMGLSCFEPMGAFYAFPDIRKTGLSSEEFCERLLKEEQVAVIPGNAFGESGEGFIRISYCYSVGHLMEAMRRISRFVARLFSEGANT